MSDKTKPGLFGTAGEYAVESLIYSLLAKLSPSMTIFERRKNAKNFAPSVLEIVEAEISWLLKQEAET